MAAFDDFCLLTPNIYAASSLPLPLFSVLLHPPYIDRLVFFFLFPPPPPPHHLTCLFFLFPSCTLILLSLNDHSVSLSRPWMGGRDRPGLLSHILDQQAPYTASRDQTAHSSVTAHIPAMTRNTGSGLVHRLASGPSTVGSFRRSSLRSSALKLCWALCLIVWLLSACCLLPRYFFALLSSSFLILVL